MNPERCECNAPATVTISTRENTGWVTVAYCWKDYLKKSAPKTEGK